MEKASSDSIFFNYICKGLITSVSGWRKEFKPNLDIPIQDESTQYDINDEDYTLVYQATTCYLEVLLKHLRKVKSTRHVCNIAIGRDSRPTGLAISRAVTQACEDYSDSHGSGYFKVVHLGLVPIPKIMSYTERYADGFIYCTASHNPVEYNGLKFGSHHGNIISKTLALKVIALFQSSVISGVVNRRETEPFRREETLRKAGEAYEEKLISAVFRGYLRIPLFHEIETASGKKDLFEIIRLRMREIGTQPGVILDPNGGARCGDFDKELLGRFNIGVQSINDEFGVFNHEILPQGKALKQVQQLLSKLIRTGISKSDEYCMACVSDCDGDRGNLVLLGESVGMSTHGVEASTKTLESQEVFSLVLSTELAWQNIVSPAAKVAIVVNGPTSMRCEIIAKYYDCEIFRVEVGEANLIDKAFELMNKGYAVPIVGEGSNGGCIILPSLVRDPLSTILSVLKILLLGNHLYKGKGNHTSGIGAVHEFLAMLPQSSTTNTDLDQALMKIPPTLTYSTYIKKVLVEFQGAYSRFEKIFADNHKRVIRTKVMNFLGSKAVEVDLSKVIVDGGGVAIQFFGNHLENNSTEETPLGFIWIRPSGTEPVVRVLADAIGRNAAEIESQLIEAWRNVLDLSMGLIR